MYSQLKRLLKLKKWERKVLTQVLLSTGKSWMTGGNKDKVKSYSTRYTISPNLEFNLKGYTYKITLF